MQNYDSEPDEGIGGIPTLGNFNSRAYYESNDDDPYLTHGGDADSIDERDELEVLDTDSVLVAVRVGHLDGQVEKGGRLEVYVYEETADNIYVNHDMLLQRSNPICVEWMSVPVPNSKAGLPIAQGTNRNFVAVGTFEPDIEIWDLDLVNSEEPYAILGPGGQDKSADVEKAKKKKKRKKAHKANDDYHVDAVLALAANRTYRTLLASASADKTVKLWDVNTTKCAKSYSFHTDKACSIAWNPDEPTILLSGSHDRTVVMAEMRAPGAQVPRWGVESDVETVRWNPHDANYFFVTTEDGFVHYHDRRAVPASPAASKPVWRLHAHDKTVSGFDVNPSVPGYVATGSWDQEVKLWNIDGQAPRLVVCRNLDVGKVFSTTFALDAEVGFHLAVAGSKGSLQIWDTSTNASVRHVFQSRMKPDQGDLKDRVVRIDGAGTDDSDSDEDDEDDDEEGGESAHEDGWESVDDA